MILKKLVDQLENINLHQNKGCTLLKEMSGVSQLGLNIIMNINFFNYCLCFSTPLLHPDWIYKWTQDGQMFYHNCAAAHHKAEEIIRNRRKALQNSVRPHVDRHLAK